MIKKWTAIISSFAVFTFIGWLILAPLYGHVGVAVWWTFSVIVIYAGLGVGLLLFSLSDTSISQATERLIKEVKLIFRHRLARDASYLATGQYIAAALNFTTNVLMARLLGPTDYGLVALVIAYPTLLWSFVATKSVSVITRYVAAFRAKGESEKVMAAVKVGYGLDLLVSLFAFALVSASAWWVSHHFYRKPELLWLMVVYSASFPLFALSGVSWAVLSSWERFRLLAVLDVLHPFIKLCLVTGLLLAGLRVAGAVVGMGLAQASIGLVMVVAATQLLKREGIGYWWKASFQPLTELKREIASFFGWNYLLVTLSGLVGQIPLMLLGRFRGPEEAGFYRLATSIITVSSYGESALGRVAYPVLSARYASSNKESILISLRRWTLWVGLPLGLLLILAIPFLPFFIPLIFGAQYKPAVPGAQILLFGAAVSAMFFWLTAFYYASGKIDLLTKGYAFFTLLVVGLSWVVIPQGGFLGLAGLVAISKILLTIVLLVQLI